MNQSQVKQHQYQTQQQQQQGHRDSFSTMFFEDSTDLDALSYTNMLGRDGQGGDDDDGGEMGGMSTQEFIKQSKRVLKGMTEREKNKSKNKVKYSYSDGDNDSVGNNTITMDSSDDSYSHRDNHSGIHSQHQQVNHSFETAVVPSSYKSKHKNKKNKNKRINNNNNNNNKSSLLAYANNRTAASLKKIETLRAATPDLYTLPSEGKGWCVGVLVC